MSRRISANANEFTGDVPLGPGESGLAERLTACVVPVPVEVLRNAGRIVTARLCAADDVDELGSAWGSLGELAIDSGMAVAGGALASRIRRP